MRKWEDAWRSEVLKFHLLVLEVVKLDDIELQPACVMGDYTNI